MGPSMRQCHAMLHLNFRPSPLQLAGQPASQPQVRCRSKGLVQVEHDMAVPQAVKTWIHEMKQTEQPP